jgi:hypothetical protein
MTLQSKRVDQLDNDPSLDGDRLILVEDPVTNQYYKTSIDDVVTTGGGTVSSVNGYTGAVTLAKSDVGLGNADNTSDATKNAAAVTLTNKTIDLASNTLTGTKAQFNTAMSDGDFATLTGSETLTNKTLTSPAITTPTGIVKGDVGLGNVDNTSNATERAAVATLTNKTLTTPVINSPAGLVKADVGLGNVDNTSNATERAAVATLTNKDLTSGTNTFPTLNQNTSGSAATLTTPRTIGTLTGDVTTAGSTFNGSANNTNATVVGKINGVALSGLATGILKNTTTTGVPSIAVAADFPTLNQNTSGTAANLSGTPALPNGTTATTQTAADNSTKLATTAYVDSGLSGKQASDSDLTTIAGLTATTDNFIQSKSSAWASRTPTQVTADLINFVGDSGSGGTKGLVPAPITGDSTKFLKGNGSWASIPGGGDALTSSSLAQFASTTSLELKTLLSDETGSGANVFANTPTLVTPVLGVASATSINKVALTAPATGSTLTIADGKTLTANKSITLDGTDSTVMTFPSSSDTVAGLAAVQTITGAWSFNDAKLILKGATSGTTTLKSGAAAGTSVITLPVATDTLIGKDTTDTLTNKTLTTPVIDQFGTASGLGSAWASVSASASGFSATTSNTIRWKQQGKTITMAVAIDGTSNSTSFSFTLPAAAKAADTITGVRVANNGAFTTTPGYIQLAAASTTATVFLTHAAVSTAWTGSGAKSMNGTFTYEAN